MRQGAAGDGLDFRHLQYSQIGLPLVEPSGAPPRVKLPIARLSPRGGRKPNPGVAPRVLLRGARPSDIKNQVPSDSANRQVAADLQFPIGAPCYGRRVEG
jgi:hypothetical protein